MMIFNPGETKKASELGIEILTESDFLKKIEKSEGNQ